MDTGFLIQSIQSTIELAFFLNKIPAGEVQQFLIAAQSEHFLTAAHRILRFQSFVNHGKEDEEIETLPSRKDGHQLVGYVINSPTCISGFSWGNHGRWT